MKRTTFAVCFIAACGYPQPDRLTDGGGVDSAVDADTSEEFTSCVGLEATCGANGASDCCATGAITGNAKGNTLYPAAFLRSYDVAPGTMYTSTANPATVSDFRLDKYEVTVGRFRHFVLAGMGTQEHPPAAGAGAHSAILNSGWDPAWTADLVANTDAMVAALKCSASHETWTDTPGANENKPINCITWHEATAFCIWDGGYLPTEAEWNYAASGGPEHRAYPWSATATATTIDCSYANYYDGSASCSSSSNGALVRVGARSPAGDARWGQSDLGGNAWEWTLDSYSGSYPNPCNDCANLSAGTLRVVRGGSFQDGAAFLRAGYRTNYSPTARVYSFGFRCARRAR
jgi:formylglycine-generating enzyme required for sulfatase activity